MEQVLKEVEELAQCGHREFVLTGIHTGSYGTGLGYQLTDLIKEMSKNPDVKRIRISSIEITELNESFLEELKTNPKICNHLHIPLQAGTNKILKFMNRKYTLEEFQAKLEQIRTIRPDMAITTDVIVGHPHENEQDFAESLKAIAAMHFAKVHVFPYSKREHTLASTMDEQVSEQAKKARSKQLVALSKELEEDYARAQIGKTLEVLTLKEHLGLTDNYLKVKLEQEYPVNTLIPCKIVDYQNGFLIGIEQVSSGVK